MIGPESLSSACGIGSAAAWGAGDFSGGLAARKCSAITVVLFSQLIGALFLVGLVLVSHEKIPGASSLIFGGIGGLCGSLGLATLYRAFAGGRIGVIAPISAVITAILPILYAFIDQGLPHHIQIFGFILALAAIWLISYVRGGGGVTAAELSLPVAAGVGFGLYFIFLGQAAAEAVTWPILAARCSSLTLMLLLFLIQKNAHLPAGKQFPLIALTGVLDMGGNALFAVAAHLGRLDIAATLSSLYPAVTVMLAWVILKERLVRQQWFGVAVALVALVCIAS